MAVVAGVPVPEAFGNKLPPGSEPNGEAVGAGVSPVLGCDPRPEKRLGPPPPPPPMMPPVEPLALVLLGPVKPGPKSPPPAFVGFANPKGDALAPAPVGFGAFAFALPPPPKIPPPAPENPPLVPGPGAPLPGADAPPAPAPPNAVLFVVFVPRLPKRPPPAAAGVEPEFEGF